MTNAHIRRIMMMTCWLATFAPAADLMPVPQQHALVQKYCAVCHTDAMKNGGLSLEHPWFTLDPSLAAMMLSKITGGASLTMAREAGTNEKATAVVDKRMRSGAMGAAGIPIPDKATIDALIHAFAEESAGATTWTLAPVVNSPALTANILREMPAENEGEARLYRLIISCNPATLEGSIQLAWSPLPQSGTLAVSVDGAAPVRYTVGGSEKMGNGSGVVTKGLAALTITGLPWPTKTLTISELIPEDTVEFPFVNLHQRRELEACFPK